jgi:hypothetical protein
MTTTVLLLTILTGQNHSIVAEYDTPQACEAAGEAHRKVLADFNVRVVYSCSSKAGSRGNTAAANILAAPIPALARIFRFREQCLYGG